MVPSSRGRLCGPPPPWESPSSALAPSPPLGTKWNPLSLHLGSCRSPNYCQSGFGSVKFQTGFARHFFHEFLNQTEFQGKLNACASDSPMRNPSRRCVRARDARPQQVCTSLSSWAQEAAPGTRPSDLTPATGKSGAMAMAPGREGTQGATGGGWAAPGREKRSFPSPGGWALGGGSYGTLPCGASGHHMPFRGCFLKWWQNAHKN